MLSMATVVSQWQSSVLMTEVVVVETSCPARPRIFTVMPEPFSARVYGLVLCARWSIAECISLAGGPADETVGPGSTRTGGFLQPGSERREKVTSSLLECP